jgi:thiamine biosynthesis lipoprotein
MTSFRYSLTILLCCFGSSALAQSQSTQFTFQGVLGTSADISLSGVSNKKAEQHVNLMLAEIKRLESLLSNYQSNSELSQLNNSSFTGTLSPELQQVLTLCEQWQKNSKNAFSCRLGGAQTIWKKAQASQQLPSRKTLRRLSRDMRKIQFNVKGKIQSLAENKDDRNDGSNDEVSDKSTAQNSNIVFDINGLAKGYIIDHAFNFLKNSLPELTAISVDIGGDGRYWHKDEKTFTLGISHLFNPKDNDIIGQVNLANKAIAASGEGARHYVINQQRFHHILNPRDGWPLSNAPGAIVIANNTVTADAVATALNAKPMQAGIDWVNQLDNVEALVVGKNGFQLASSNWHSYTVANKAAESRALENKAVENTANVIVDSTLDFTLNFTIPTLDVDDYEKPYVAVWLTNSKRKVIKNLLLLGKSEQWAQTNKRWWRKSGRHNELLLDGLARPTRKPGNYQLNWDWRDDYGKLVPEGEYQLHIEVSREHGEVNLTTLTFNNNNLPMKQKKVAQGEIGELILSIGSD